MKQYDIRDIGLAPAGHTKIEWVRHNMPLLADLEEEFRRDRPFEGVKISLSVHLEAKTARLCLALAAGGAQMFVTGSNVLSTQDDVAAALAEEGLSVFAYHGATQEEYDRHIEMCLSCRPNIIIDDGGDLVGMLHTGRPDLAEEVWGGCEETTTGIIRLKAMEREGILKFPMVAVNDAACKHLFDNRYGTGQSVWDSIMRNTNLIIASKTVVVVGYGWCSRGIAMRADALGARVIVTEIDPVKAIEARMDGYEVMTMAKAAPLGDIFVSATGCCKTITVEHMMTMKDRAILTNAGHFNCEIDMDALEQAAVEKKETRNNIMGYRLPNGKWINVIAEGRLVNIAAADGHPAEIMDMSFAVQALSALYIREHHEELRKGVVDVSAEIDDRVARRRLAAWGIEIDRLTDEQEAYLNSWNV
ncbi:adenosylhomocysteinase [Hornefia butyriciproducens]|uniref:Adenosylhomocysteinase n=1 Tax=Hornefia butyriciproducens TaxID=2652293 RepID=A0A6L5Y2R8_9FIRM|nr:adenosylhomocysteinase [Hornefia butyriciproducens]MCI7413021.1 adenosylhomocysteinase [Clostridiales bacterium]MDD6300016.1 adenosylhomocysteinase [Hornefia butyriciproducens]MDD7020581.1 adenosylhomocysteinase [Hornefia butyriciproducens]MDY2991140.1 adenosylhomocysteinase [Hornefia butyriciproducens]MDY5423103.1 adenosylhomocysteinase [Hornefia butyriciproducens]